MAVEQGTMEGEVEEGGIIIIEVEEIVMGDHIVVLTIEEVIMAGEVGAMRICISNILREDKESPEMRI